MTESNNVRIVKAAYLAYQEADIPALLKFLTDDVRWFEVGPEELIPTAGERKGREQVKEFFATLEASEDIQSFTPLHFVAQGDSVVVLGELRSRVKSTGVLIKSPWVHVFTLSDGMIKEFRSFYDSAAAVKAYQAIRPSSEKVGTSATRKAAIF